MPQSEDLVEVYFNIRLHLFSVRDARTRRVVQHLLELHLTDAEFRVSAAGRQRVLRTGVKNVHAVVRGRLARTPGVDGGVHVRYNPFRDASFVDPEGCPVRQARHASLRIVDQRPLVTASI